MPDLSVTARRVLLLMFHQDEEYGEQHKEGLLVYRPEHCHRPAKREPKLEPAWAYVSRDNPWGTKEIGPLTVPERTMRMLHGRGYIVLYDKETDPWVTEYYDLTEKAKEFVRAYLTTANTIGAGDWRKRHGIPEPEENNA